MGSPSGRAARRLVLRRNIVDETTAARINKLIEIFFNAFDITVGSPKYRSSLAIMTDLRRDYRVGTM
jgi:hypothetical protein